MREIREVIFRGKRTDNGEWVCGYYTKARYFLNKKEMHIIFEPDVEAFPHCEFTGYEEVLPETVGQYTGLTDKNGVKIFEGDIVRHDENYHDMVISYDVENWGGWLYEDMDDNMQAYSIYEFCLKDIAVVGNIHDNPDIIKGGGDNG